ncbi:hypothetical protein [Rathayibacter tritici]|uniref:Abi-like protein n=1 Tax=Rathayibacter tritici TaxID=33888 RepID=A0A160KQC5_9MICO|nr:hypothetical protein [Rathayibacter tritici]AND15359.1 hypothetical protein A6122_0195 [Rathayibacter tritici]PPI47958.1 hypothetical protein C5D18_02545 [Rathayibacter tritici]
MVPAASPIDDTAISAALSGPRASTYVAAVGGDLARAMTLYGWNARVSAALMLPSHFSEVTTRNAAADVLEQVYGPRWPWNSTFFGSLPNPGPGGGFNPRRELSHVRNVQPTTGKVIAELKFVFWQKLFTGRHDVRLRQPHIAAAFPQAPTMSADALRNRIYGDLETLRRLRNRLAHHEPIFTRNLGDDLNRMLDLIGLRSAPATRWVKAMEDVTSVIAERP